MLKEKKKKGGGGGGEKATGTRKEERKRKIMMESYQRLTCKTQSVTGSVLAFVVGQVSVN